MRGHEKSFYEHLKFSPLISVPKSDIQERITFLDESFPKFVDRVNSHVPKDYFLGKQAICLLNTNSPKKGCILKL